MHEKGFITSGPDERAYQFFKMAWGSQPVIIFLMKSLCPGASIMVMLYFRVSNFHKAISMVIPLSLSAFSLSSTQAYLKEPFPI